MREVDDPREFLAAIRREVAKTPGLFGASPRPCPAAPAAAAEASDAEAGRALAGSLEPYGQEVRARGRGCYHRAPDLDAGLPEGSGSIRRGQRRRRSLRHVGSRGARLDAAPPLPP